MFIPIFLKKYLSTVGSSNHQKTCWPSKAEFTTPVTGRKTMSLKDVLVSQKGKSGEDAYRVLGLVV